MRKILTVLCLLSGLTTWAKPQVYFNYKVFHTPEQGPYLSTSLQFIAGSLEYKGDGQGTFNSSIEITHLFTSNDRIILVDKYMLDSPEMKDSTIEDFYDMQRYKLPAGIYTYELVIKDLISGEQVQGKQDIEIKALNPTEITLSDIEFIEDLHKTDEENNFTKNGYFMLPYLTNYFPPQMDKIAFYAEVYNTDQFMEEGEQFLMTYSIEHYKSGLPVEGIFKFKRLNSAPVVPQIIVLPITELRSGDYYLRIDLINKNNDTLHTEKVFFQRRNDLVENDFASIKDIEIDPSFKNSITRDSIPYFLGSLLPISEPYEYEIIRTMLKGNDTTFMEQYFFAYWRQTAPENPYFAWNDYKLQVYYTERLFGTQIKNGWESDRGRVHLQYGAPNAVIDRPNEPSAYPYQIWHYYRIGQRSNVRFVFYNPDLATNDYPLLHSDMRGELQNFRWEGDLHRRDTPNTNVDDPGGSVHYGGNSGTFYRGGM